MYLLTGYSIEQYFSYQRTHCLSVLLALISYSIVQKKRDMSLDQYCEKTIAPMKAKYVFSKKFKVFPLICGVNNYFPFIFLIATLESKSNWLFKSHTN